MTSLLSSIVEFLKDNLQGNQAAGDPLPPGKLGTIATTINKLSQIQLSTGNNGLADWLDELDRVLGDTALRDTIIVRALQLRAPRLAEALTFAGLITAEYRDEDPRAFAFRLAWNRLDDFLRDPGTTTLVAVVDRIQDIGDLQIAQVLAGMLLFSPRELLTLEYAQQGFAALPDERNDGAIDLTRLVEDLIGSPLKIAIPIAPPLDIDTLETQAAAGKVAGVEYLGILGPDALGAHVLEGYGVELKLNDVQGFAARSLDLGGGLRLVASSVDTGPVTYRLVIKGDGTIDPANASAGEFEAGLQWSPPGGVTLIGPSDGTRMEIGPARFTFCFQKPGVTPTPCLVFAPSSNASRSSFPRSPLVSSPRSHRCRRNCECWSRNRMTGGRLGARHARPLSMQQRSGMTLNAVVDFFGPTLHPAVTGDWSKQPPVLIHHGTLDPLNIENSRHVVRELEAVHRQVTTLTFGQQPTGPIADDRFIEYPGEAHGFTGAALAASRSSTTAFLERQLS